MWWSQWRCGVHIPPHPGRGPQAVFPTLVRWDVFNKVTPGVLRRRDLRWMGVRLFWVQSLQCLSWGRAETPV